MIEVTDRQINLIDTAEGLVVLLLYTTWCPLCIQMTKALRAAEQNQPITAARVDLVKNPNCTSRFCPTGVPTILALRQGQVIARYKGLIDLEGAIAPLL